jgi:two-component sensor histidine kinase
MGLLSEGKTRLFVGIFAVFITGQMHAQSPTTYYDTAKQRLLAVAASQFINNVTQGEIEPDSAQLLACKIYGFGRLLPYNEGYPNGSASEGSRLIEHGEIAAAIKLSVALTGIDRIRLYLDLGSYYLFKPGSQKPDLDSALACLQQAVESSTSPGSEKWLNAGLALLGKYYYQAGDRSRGQSCFLQVVAACEKQNDQPGLALALENAGQYLIFNDPARIKYLEQSLSIYQHLKLKEKQIELLSLIVTTHFWTDWTKAGPELQQVLDLQTSIGYRHTQYVHYVMGYLHSNQGNRIAALNEDEFALAAMQQTHDTALSPIVDLQIGGIFYMLDRSGEALVWYKRGIKYRTRELQPFWYYDFLALIILSTQGSRLDEAAQMLQNIEPAFPPTTLMEKVCLVEVKGEYYWKSGQMELARKSFDSFAIMAARIPPQYIGGAIPDAYTQIAKFEFQLGHYDTVQQLLEKIKLTWPANKQNVHQQMELALLHFKLDSVSGNFPAALTAHVEYMAIHDSLNSLLQHNEIDELLVRNETEKKEHNIQLLTQQGRLQQTDLQHAHLLRNVLIAGACLLFVILTLLFYQYRIKQNANRIVTQKNHAMEQLLGEKEALITDKETLVKEIHHRVKNNLHLISSLLESQSAYLQDEALFAIQKSQHRVQAISLIHQRLYLNDQVSNVEMSIYLREIISYLRDSFVTDENITFDLDLDPIQLDVSQAVPLGLIVNEAVTNAVKYAFPYNKTGMIGINLKREPDGACHLRISDNGVGLPGDFDAGQNNSLGMSLIKGLSRTLQADLRISSFAGTTIHLCFYEAHSMAVVE